MKPRAYENEHSVNPNMKAQHLFRYGGLALLLSTIKAFQLNVTRLQLSRMGAMLLAFSCVRAGACTAPPNQVNLRIPPVGTGGSGDTNKDVTLSTLTVGGFAANQSAYYFNVKHL
jgi:hypothetical protein